MFQYPSNDLLIFNETDNAHFPLASGAGKGISLINLLTIYKDYHFQIDLNSFSQLVIFCLFSFLSEVSEGLERTARTALKSS